MRDYMCARSDRLTRRYNNVLNVWQPMYTHLFESVIAQPKPWYYVHLQTPGGTKNLMNEDFALDTPDAKTPRVGVLMRIVHAQRGKDSRLTCVVQVRCSPRGLVHACRWLQSRASFPSVQGGRASRALRSQGMRRHETCLTPVNTAETDGKPPPERARDGAGGVGGHRQPGPDRETRRGWRACGCWSRRARSRSPGPMSSCFPTTR